MYAQLTVGHDPCLEQSWKRIGFMRHCREYCFLGLVMCERLQLDSSKEENSIILSGFPNRYDETDMHQVNEIIKRFPIVTSTS